MAGLENLVLEVNGEYVFRFPKFKESGQRLRKEIRLLPLLRRHLSTPVPDYKFVWKGNRARPQWFGGYRKIDGVTAATRHYRSEWTRPLAREISHFLKALHGIDLKVYGLKDILEFSSREWPRSIEGQYRKIRRIVYPLLRPELRDRSKDFWRNLLADFARADFKPTLIHGDLSDENILFDPGTLKLTGIIDWGYAQISDPALDISHLLLHRPELGKEVLRVYGSRQSDFANRVQWYVDSEPYYDIVWGITHDWKKPTAVGMRNLMRMLKQWA